MEQIIVILSTYRGRDNKNGLCFPHLVTLSSLSLLLLLFSVGSGVEKPPVTLELFPVQSLAFDGSGRFLAIAGGVRSGKLIVWDIPKGGIYKEFDGHSKKIESVSFSFDGKLLASASYDKTIRLWDLASGKQLGKLDGFKLSHRVLFSPDGKSFASGGMPNDDHAIGLWDVKTMKPIRTFLGHHGFIMSLSFSANGNRLASCASDNKVKVWDLAGARVVTLEAHSKPVNSVSLSPGGEMVACGNEEGTIELWDLSSLKRVTTLNAFLGQVRCVQFSPDGRVLASAEGAKNNTREGFEARLWRVQGWKLIQVYKAHSLPALSLSFSPNGKVLASGSMDGKVKLWDISLVTKLLKEEK